MSLNIVIMAAGRGTRMNSTLPKVLHALAGYPMIHHVIATADQLNPDELLLVTGYGHEEVRAYVGTMKTRNVIPGFVVQTPQLGTGHAVATASPFLQPDGHTLILNGDTPLITRKTLAKMIEQTMRNQLAILTTVMDDPTGYGRVQRDFNGDVLKIIEQKDCTPAEAEIKEVYTGTMLAPTNQLKRWLAGLDNNNAQGEYYLTDIVKMALVDGIPIFAMQPANAIEVAGVNSPEQLLALEELLTT